MHYNQNRFFKGICVYPSETDAVRYLSECWEIPSTLDHEILESEIVRGDSSESQMHRLERRALRPGNLKRCLKSLLKQI